MNLEKKLKTSLRLISLRLDLIQIELTFLVLEIRSNLSMDL